MATIVKKICICSSPAIASDGCVVLLCMKEAQKEATWFLKFLNWVPKPSPQTPGIPNKDTNLVRYSAYIPYLTLNKEQRMRTTETLPFYYGECCDGSNPRYLERQIIKRHPRTTTMF